MWFQFSPLGRRGETAAKRYLRRRGYRILKHSYQCSMGEIDLIASSRETIVFVEVKTRSSADHGEPWEAVDRRKRRQITRAAVHFLKEYALTDRPVRFDVVAVTWGKGWFQRPKIEHFDAAFNAEGPWSV